MRQPFATIFVLASALGLLAGCQTHRAAPVPAVMPATSIELRTPRPGLPPEGRPAAGEGPGVAAGGAGRAVGPRALGELKRLVEPAEVRAAGMRYLSIPVAGAGGIDDANAQRLRTALEAANGPVLVHCASGNRVGGLLALMQARSGGMTTEQALEFGRKAGMVGTEARVRELLDAGE